MGRSGKREGRKKKDSRVSLCIPLWHEVKLYSLCLNVNLDAFSELFCVIDPWHFYISSSFTNIFKIFMSSI